MHRKSRKTGETVDKKSQKNLTLRGWWDIISVVVLLDRVLIFIVDKNLIAIYQNPIEGGVRFEADLSAEQSLA